MLSQIKLRDFRCFRALDLRASPGAQFFIGDNAQGKTSILEAVCVLLRLASPRSTTLGPLVRLGTPSFGLRGVYGGSELQFRFGPEGRKIVLDGEEKSGVADYLRVAKLVYFANSDLELVRGPAEGRRRFLDFLGSQIEPLYRVNLRAYEKALRSRNRLLKAYPVRRREVEAYNGPLLDAGELLTQLRRSLVAELTPWARRAQAAVGGKAEGLKTENLKFENPKAESGNEMAEDNGSGVVGTESEAETVSGSASGETLSLDYQPGSGANFAEALAAARDEETRLRQTVVGPHRDDLVLRLGGQPAGVFGSEGQQRTLALALKLAQAGLLESVSKTPPVLLLDDIFGELDPARRNALLAALPANAQQFVTTTHLDWLDAPPPGPVWRLSEQRLELKYEG